ncbi:uncharacterized protein LOC110708530 [Chenopodium quinoa]|uniref:uncharacterized protein LOC110708530 n=1 Tax=Chenopodium quinoa TaxID=63459 RepID=UPI000B773B19|nr:uncharacterized protein LOC110708530 [Chenopodium quinoa]
MLIWNKAAVCKLLWAISCKKDKLWVKWIDAYYTKGRDITSISCPANSSWALRKIFECSQIIISASGWDRFIKKGSFSIKEMYKHLHGDFVKVPWSRVLCQNLASPRSLFISWLAMHNRLPTRARLTMWGVVDNSSCCLCNTAPETVGHLFFECAWSSQIWTMVLAHLHFQRGPGNFTNELAWIMKSAKKKAAKHQVALMFFAECVYAIWLHRNDHIFNQGSKTVSAAQLFRDIRFKVACRCREEMRKFF